MRYATILPVLTLLASCAEESSRLDAGQLAEFFRVERTGEFSSFRFAGTVTFKTDKTAFLSTPAIGDDTGIWWLEGDRFCSKWEEAAKGETTCIHVSRFADGTFSGVDTDTGLAIGRFKLAE